MVEKGYQKKMWSNFPEKLAEIQPFRVEAKAQESLLLLEELDHRSFQATTITYNVAFLHREVGKGLLWKWTTLINDSLGLGTPLVISGKDLVIISRPE